MAFFCFGLGDMRWADLDCVGMCRAVDIGIYVVAWNGVVVDDFILVLCCAVLCCADVDV